MPPGGYPPAGYGDLDPLSRGGQDPYGTTGALPPAIDRFGQPSQQQGELHAILCFFLFFLWKISFCSDFACN